MLTIDRDDTYILIIFNVLKEKFTSGEWDNMVELYTGYPYQPINTVALQPIDIISIGDLALFTRRVSAINQLSMFIELLDLIEPLIPEDDRTHWIYCLYCDNHLELLRQSLYHLPQANRELFVKLFGMLHDFCVAKADNGSVQTPESVAAVFGRFLMRPSSSTTPESDTTESAAVDSSSSQGDYEHHLSTSLTTEAITGSAVARLMIDNFDYFFNELHQQIKARDERAERMSSAFKTQMEAHYQRLGRLFKDTIARIKPKPGVGIREIYLQVFEDDDYKLFVKEFNTNFKINGYGRCSLKKQNSHKRLGILPDTYNDAG
ncbi:hypothetical protein SAMD00019534_011280, partial [Acytostelium subglobosum LB1]|uniref:hypothetical protein n=1 Tax=Acytostelium subglobosum LB1 TaxID=1410327 RepID=UPI000644EF0C